MAGIPFQPSAGNQTTGENTGTIISSPTGVGGIGGSFMTPWGGITTPLQGGGSGFNSGGTVVGGSGFNSGGTSANPYIGGGGGGSPHITQSTPTNQAQVQAEFASSGTSQTQQFLNSQAANSTGGQYVTPAESAAILGNSTGIGGNYNASQFQANQTNFSSQAASAVGYSPFVSSEASNPSSPSQLNYTLNSDGSVTENGITYSGKSIIPGTGKTANQINQEGFKEARSQGINQMGTYSIKYTQTQETQKNPSNVNVKPSINLGLTGGTISASPGFFEGIKNEIQNQGFFPTILNEAGYGISDVLNWKPFGGESYQTQATSNLGRLIPQIAVYSNPITAPVFAVGTGIASYTTPGGNVERLEYAQNLNKAYGISPEISHAISNVIPGLQGAAGILGGFSEAMPILTPESKVLGISKMPVLGEEGGFTQAETNVFVKTQVPKFFGGTTDINSLLKIQTIYPEEESQIGISGVKGVSSVDKGSVIMPGGISDVKIGDLYSINAKIYSSTAKLEGMGGEYESTEYLGVTSSQKLKNSFGLNIPEGTYEPLNPSATDFSKALSNPEKVYFTGSLTGKGENPFIFRGGSYSISGGEAENFLGSYEGAIFQNKIISPGENPSEVLNGAKGRGIPSSSNFFQDLYSAQEATEITKALTVAETSKPVQKAMEDFSSFKESADTLRSGLPIGGSLFAGKGQYEITQYESPRLTPIQTKSVQGSIINSIDLQPQIQNFGQIQPQSLLQRQIYQSSQLQRQGQLQHSLQNQYIIQGQIQGQLQRQRQITQQQSEQINFNFQQGAVSNMKIMIPSFAIPHRGKTSQKQKTGKSNSYIYAPDFSSKIFGFRLPKGTTDLQIKRLAQNPFSGLGSRPQLPLNFPIVSARRLRR